MISFILLFFISFLFPNTHSLHLPYLNITTTKTAVDFCFLFFFFFLQKVSVLGMVWISLVDSHQSTHSQMTSFSTSPGRLRLQQLNDAAAKAGSLMPGVLAELSHLSGMRGSNSSFN